MFVLITHQKQLYFTSIHRLTWNTVVSDVLLKRTRVLLHSITFCYIPCFVTFHYNIPFFGEWLIKACLNNPIDHMTFHACERCQTTSGIFVLQGSKTKLKHTKHYKSICDLHRRCQNENRTDQVRLFPNERKFDHMKQIRYTVIVLIQSKLFLLVLDEGDIKILKHMWVDMEESVIL